MCFIDRINTKLDADVGESFSLIDLDDFLARVFQFLFVNRLVEFHFDFLAQPFRADMFGARDFDLANNRPRLHGDNDFDAVAFRLSKDSDVSNVIGFVQRLDVLLHDLVRLRLANFCAHLRQNAFFADCRWACVLHVHGADDGRSRSRLWRLRPDNYGREQRTKGGDPNRNRRGAHPSTKTLHMLEAQPHAIQTDAGQAPISEIRPQSSRRDFH